MKRTQEILLVEASDTSSYLIVLAIAYTQNTLYDPDDIDQCKLAVKEESSIEIEM